MTTVTVEEKSRISLPGLVKGEVYRVEQLDRGQYLLVRQGKQKSAEPFPPGSLARFFTPKKNEEELALLGGCSLEVSGD